MTQLGAEFFELAPIGMAILRLEEPDNPASLRVLALNPQASVVSDVAKGAVGKRIDRDFPAIAQTPFPAQLAEVMRSQRAANLGEGPGTCSAWAARRSSSASPSTATASGATPTSTAHCWNGFTRNIRFAKQA